MSWRCRGAVRYIATIHVEFSS